MTTKNIPATERFNARVTPELKCVLNGIQQFDNHSQKGMLNHFVDLYLKYHEGSAEKQIAYAVATINDTELSESVVQFINDFKFTEVMKTPTLCSEIKALKLEVEELRSQIQHILKQYPYVVDSTVCSSTSILQPDTTTESATDLTNFFSTIVSDSTTKHTNSTLSLNNIILNKLKNKVRDGFEFTYASFAYNYASLKSVSPDAVSDIQNEVELFNTELMLLLSNYCDNLEMRKAFVPTNIDLFTSYLDSRLTKEGISNVIVSDIWNFTLSEIEDIIISLPKFTVDKNFTMNATTLNSPQSTMKTVLRNQYGLIFKHVNQFETF